MSSDEYRLERIVAIGAQLLDVISNRSLVPDDLMTDLETQWMVSTPLYNIGEHVNRLSDEFIANHPGIPWSQIAGMRHRLVHDYEGTNWSIISSVVFDELPEFVRQVEGLLVT